MITAGEGRGVSGASRFEVRYRRITVKPGDIAHPGVFVWGWASDRKELAKLMDGLAANPQLQHVETVDRERITKLDQAADLHIEQAQPGLLI